MFHHFHGAGHYQGQGSINADDLRAIIHYLGVENCLAPQAWIQKGLADELAPQEYCLTFDDNLRCQFDVARPVLDALGLKAFWFVQTLTLVGEVDWLEIYRYFRHVYFDDVHGFYRAFIDQVEQTPLRATLQEHRPLFEAGDYLKVFPYYSDLDRWFRYIRDELLSLEAYNTIMGQMLQAAGVDVVDLNQRLYMGADELRTLHAEGHTVGMHSHSHPTQLNKLSPAEQRQEYAQCFQILRDTIGAPPISMSHPCGSYNQDTWQILQELAIQIGFDGVILPHNMPPYAFMRCEHNYIMEKIAHEDHRIHP